MSPRKTKAKKRKSARRRRVPAGRKSARRPESRPAAPATWVQARGVGARFEALVALQAQLRGPGGCPWDREQTHSTLRTYLIEEAYEVLDALESGAPQEMAEELGDLLLQVLFHADLARAARTFDIADVISGIHDKMVRRHPHVFGTVQARTSGVVLKNWEKLKAEEKVKKNAAGGWAGAGDAASLLDDVPRSLPALLEAYQLTRRAARIGFDWSDVGGIFEKLNEEVKELRQAIGAGNKVHVDEEVGDLLFVAVNLARFLKVDPEVALKRSNRKFKSRFQIMERDARRTGQALADLSQSELEILWEAAKMQLRGTIAQGLQGRRS